MFSDKALAAHQVLCSYNVGAKVATFPLDNGFDMWLHTLNGVDTYLTFPNGGTAMGHFVNSAVCPNVSYVVWDHPNGTSGVAIVTLRAIAKGEELFGNYMQDILGRACTERVDLAMRMLWAPPATHNGDDATGIIMTKFMGGSGLRYLQMEWHRWPRAGKHAWCFFSEFDSGNPKYFLLKQKKPWISYFLTEIGSAPVSMLDSVEATMDGFQAVKPVPWSMAFSKAAGQEIWAKMGYPELCLEQSEYCRCGFTPFEEKKEEPKVLKQLLPPTGPPRDLTGVILSPSTDSPLAPPTPETPPRSPSIEFPRVATPPPRAPSPPPRSPSPVFEYSVATPPIPGLADYPFSPVVKRVRWADKLCVFH